MTPVWRNLALLGATALGAMALVDPSLAQEAATAATDAAAAAPEAVAEAAAAAATTVAKAPELVVNKADDGWMMVSSLLVLLMTVPGVALFYGGMVRTKNMLSMLTQVFMIQCVVCVIWFVYGYSLTFTSSEGALAPFIGGFSRLFLSGIDSSTVAATFTPGVGIHELVFVCFQMTFAAITTALAVGGFAERMKFSAVFLFSILWVTIVYFPIAHMVWSNPGPADLALNNEVALAASGFGFQMGALDFAGGTVVHINAGIAGLVGALLVGRRIGYGKEPMPPHSLTLTMVGAALLWVGWFGFNAGSSLEANGTAVLAMANTFIATAAAGLSWLLVEWLFKGKPSLLGLASGVVAGLVAVTPASGFAGPMGALVLGLVAGAVCFFFCTAVKSALGYDDTLDVFGVHAVGGILGAIGTGILAAPIYGGTGVVDYTKCEIANGILTDKCPVGEYDVAAQVLIQIKNVALTGSWSLVGSVIVFLIISVVVGLRVSTEKEREGLDISEHGERAYNM
ncbi:ammonium transporter [Rhodomicrobium vannielii ATCC 17100]|jgi:ammonium transporter, Amt family|uniref:Ammonium transporter n=1 Tax=Rhodomicrobium vannielii (strain ATCC 17100 / DSM 162 / LMG 4299 / NCIMB 10020 / ATH 3.1.1) TaxID=648757 RepID=E3I393_RHOVT|nr:ammonium transporter [Rhodomicrobium vannielii]ADP71454.1 ammonium transporter [Rhodomicrobium vannielii ATCC 17100]